jgi:hypothetical protein
MSRSGRLVAAAEARRITWTAFVRAPVLSIREPWASAILGTQGKRIENRYWRPSYRGPLWIHASKSMTRREYDEACNCMRFTVQVNPPARSDLRFGGVVGLVWLAGVLKPGAHPYRQSTQEVEVTDADLSWWDTRQFGFFFSDAWRLPELIECDGDVGLWHLPPNVAAKALEALRTIDTADEVAS